MRRAVWLLALGLLWLCALPARAEPVINEAEVAVCLEREAARAERCFGLIAAPCGHLVEAGLARSCYARLSRRWLLLVERAGTGAFAETWPPERDLIHGVGGDGCPGLPAGSSPQVGRNACRLFLLALAWMDATAPARRQLGRVEDRSADVVALERCIERAEGRGAAGACVGQVRDTCLDAGASAGPSACVHRERIAWATLAGPRESGRPGPPLGGVVCRETVACLPIRIRADAARAIAGRVAAQ